MPITQNTALLALSLCLVPLAWNQASAAQDKPALGKAETVDLSEGIPEAWLETRPMPRRRFDKMVGEAAPEIQATRWLNSDPLGKRELEGSVVLLYFWTPDCPSCGEIVANLNALHELYEVEGLVILGVCMSYSDEGYERKVRELGMKFPVCVDQIGKTQRAYKTDGTPDFFLIDREGTLRIADMHDHAVVPAVISVLAEDDKDAPGEE